jgi:hypothetical protein
MILGVYFGNLAIKDLLDELKMMNDEYGDSGKFKIA